MNRELITSLRERLFLSGISTGNLSAELEKVDLLLNGIDRRGTVSEIAEVKSRIKTDLANIITELNKINSLIQ